MNRTKQAKGAVQLWYEARVQFGHARYPRVKERKLPREIPKERSGDPLAHAKRERPENWTRRKARHVHDADGNPVFDSAGNPVVESVDICDVMTADGSETRPSPRTQPPRGQGMAVEVSERRRGPRQPMTPAGDPLTFINQTMLRVGIVDPDMVTVLEMWAAGHTQRDIAEKLDVPSKNTVDVLFQKAIGIIEFALLVRPDYGKEVRYIPTMTLAYIGC